MAGLVIFLAIELEDRRGRGECQSVVCGGSGDPGLHCWGDIKTYELLGCAYLHGLRRCSKRRDGGVGNAVFVPGSGYGQNIHGARGVRTIAVDAQNCARYLRGGRSGWQKRKVKLQKSGVAAANVQVGKGSGVDGRARA